MGKKEAYKEKNLQYLQVLSTRADICSLPCGIFYEVLQAGTGTASPTLRSIVTVHYKGSLINGKEFDNSYSRNCPEAFRLCDVIEGWQLALRQMFGSIRSGTFRIFKHESRVVSTLTH